MFGIGKDTTSLSNSPSQPLVRGEILASYTGTGAHREKMMKVEQGLLSQNVS